MANSLAYYGTELIRSARKAYNQKSPWACMVKYYGFVSYRLRYKPGLFVSIPVK